MMPAAGRRRPGRRAAGCRRGHWRRGGPRCWSRFSTAIRCMRCGRRWPRTPRRPGCRRAGSGISSWPCTSWPPTRSATAPGTGGCGSGRHRTRCAARSATTAPDGVPHRLPGARPGTPALEHGARPRPVAHPPGRGPGQRATPARAARSPWSASRWDRRGCCRRSGWTGGPATAARSLAVTGRLDLGSAGQLGQHGRRAGPGGPRAAPGPGPVRPDRLGLRRAGRADHRPGADRRAPRRPDGSRRAARAPAAAARGAGLDDGFTWAGTPAEALTILSRAT